DLFELGDETRTVGYAFELDLGLTDRGGCDVGDVGAVPVDELGDPVENAWLVAADNQQRELSRVGFAHEKTDRSRPHSRACAQTKPGGFAVRIRAKCRRTALMSIGIRAIRQRTAP